MIQFAHIRTKNAFTLVELMVAISIIGLLSSIIMASLNDARRKSRDVRRVTDLLQIRTALNIFLHDNNEYPDNVVGLYGASGSIAGKYIAAVPLDPYTGAQYKNFSLLSIQNPLACGAAQICLGYHLGAIMENPLPNGNMVLQSDADLYKGAAVPPGGDFEGSSKDCSTTEDANDGCYDIAL
jgi:prepilin-type N-terminal cleavage/methylation domain-containing protein